jgi:superfamily II DNA or RNA helicase
MRVLLQLPTGGGKTLTSAAMLASALGKGSRSMFVAHRLELIDQTVATFARLGVLEMGVIRANDPRRDISQPIQIASVQTLARRKIVVDGVKIIFIDEAHRANSDSYVKNLFDAYPDAVFVGLSATPCRSDGKPLGKFFDVLVHGPTYARLIAEGHIVEPHVYSTPVLPDLSSVRTTAGDYNAEDLEAAVNRRALIGNLLSEWQTRGGGHRTVAFAVSVAHSRAIVDQFTEAGVSAEHLDGTTPEDQRRAILARLASGETRVVSNVGVLCEGWDLPACKTMLLARPTKSLALYMQMAGRILRPWEGVTPIILDHGGNVDRHGMPHEDREWSLDGKVKRAGSPPAKACPSCFAMIAAALMTCPHCGHEFPAPVSAPPEEESLTHVELALRTLDGDDAELTFFRTLSKRARDNKWKPGAVYHRFCERFGHEPPRSWTAALRKGFRRDVDWKGAVSARVEVA